jgi:hypothetical protein
MLVILALKANREFLGSFAAIKCSRLGTATTVRSFSTTVPE